jgi:hypothetical protein
MTAITLPPRSPAPGVIALHLPANRRATAGRDAARQLEALVQEAVSTGTARQALLLRLSALPRALARPHHLRLAIEALEPLTDADRARLFVLPNHDAVVIWRGAAQGALAASLDRLETLFAGEGAAPPSRLLALPEAAGELLRAAADSLHPPVPAAPPPPRAPLDEAALLALEAALDRADLTRFARRHPVVRLLPDGTWRLAWDMRHFSLPELAETLAPDRDLAAEPWLLRRLTRTLDQRMMALLASPRELDGAGPFGLSLNIDSILSPGFLRFDAALPPALRGQVVLAVRPEDLAADAPAFAFARGFAQARGYRIMLAPLGAATVAAFPAEASGVDLVELCWSPELDVVPPGLVLAGVDTLAALEWARGRRVEYVAGKAVR